MTRPARRLPSVQYVQWHGHHEPLRDGMREIEQRHDDHHARYGRLVAVEPPSNEGAPA